MFTRTFAYLLCTLAAPSVIAAECDVSAGKKQYNKCVACHSTEPGVQLMGPSLHGILGREVGTVDGFVYSPAMETAGFIWSEEKLDEFLASPSSTVPETTMPFGGIRNPDQRAALICYLQNQR